MKHKILKTSATLPLLAAAVLYSSAAFSAPLTNAFVDGQQQWSDDSAEVLIDNDNSGSISAGDYLVGILGITSFPTSGVAANSVNEMTAIFAAEIVTVEAVPVSLIPSVCGSAAITSCSGFTFTAVPDFNAAFTAADALTGASTPTYTQLDGVTALTSDTIAIFLEDPLSDFNRDGSTQAVAFNTATNGTSRLIVELLSGDTWTATGPADLTDFALVPSGTGIGGFSINATITGQDFAGWLFDPLITANGSIKPTTASSFVITDDTTFEVNASRIPEPATLGLMSIALLGFGAVRRRKDRSSGIKG